MIGPTAEPSSLPLPSSVFHKSQPRIPACLDQLSSVMYQTIPRIHWRAPSYVEKQLQGLVSHSRRHFRPHC